MENKPNRLVREKSPYLLQHAYNPVDWYPWSNEAFEKAKAEDKLIFLSIGYYTCHWCHVMEDESFADQGVADMLNSSFVSIKVDREERPDIDSTYMKIAQAMTGSGGWPLTIIMTPDKKPIFAATYIPKNDRDGMIGLKRFLPLINAQWLEHTAELEKTADFIFDEIRKTKSAAGSIDNKFLEKAMGDAYLKMRSAFDETNGGFGVAPKFPDPTRLIFLLRYWKRYKKANAVNMVERTLSGIRNGGIYDHIGYGIHRYSTSADWRVPHFEKMLYDQALLANACIEAYQATKNEYYKKIAEEVFEFVLRELTSKDGAFYSALDADSEGEEGRFYLWKLEDIEKSLGKGDARLAAAVFNASGRGNFEGGNEMNILYTRMELSEMSHDLKIGATELSDKLSKIRKTLLEYRNKRVRPATDTKVLVDWNSLMIAALAKAASAFGVKQHADAASRAADFILSKMFKGGILYHRYFEGDVNVPAFLDDYAFFAMGLIELYQATFNPRYLKRAMEINDQMYRLFWRNGAFYSTQAGGDSSLLMEKEINDSALPSGNAVAILDSILLGHMTGNMRLIDNAMRSLAEFKVQMGSYPAATVQALVSADAILGPLYEIVVAGEIEADTMEMIKDLNNAYVPNKVLLLVYKDARLELNSIAGFTEGLKSVGGKATSYICFNYKCELPITDPYKLREKLKEL